ETMDNQISFYFAYGSNMCKTRLLERKVEYVSRSLAYLQGHQLEFTLPHKKLRNMEFIKDDHLIGYANVSKVSETTSNVIDQFCKSSVVYGILIELKTKEEIYKLDFFEGIEFGHYTRERVQVQRIKEGREETVEALIYFAGRNLLKNGLKPSKKYMNYLLGGSDLLPTDYVENLKQLETH
ncbi:hypothetical protein HDU92_004257, partial [Lobulomyces angularis]